MPNHRTPVDKAEVNGRAQHDSKRFEGRRSAKGLRPVGDPPEGLTEDQQAVWHEMAKNIPWLTSSDRYVLQIACVLQARFNSNPEMGISALNALSANLSKLGASPSDLSKVSYDGGESEDPDDEFFTTH